MERCEMATTPIAPRPPAPQSNNNVIWWILGIFGGGILLLAVCGLVIATMVLHHVRVDHSGDNVAIETPAGALRISKGDPHATGLPEYPGSLAIKSEGADIEVSSNNNRAGLAIEKFHTSDSRDVVQTWYRKHLGPSYRLETNQTAKSAIRKWNTDVDPDDIAFVDDRNDGARVIALKAVGGSTDIVLIRAGKQEPQ
jgi:hypothetical protein